jgi:hypothetical protein
MMNPPNKTVVSGERGDALLQRLITGTLLALAASLITAALFLYV